MTAARWQDALITAGAIPASHVPDQSLGREDLIEVAGAELVEDARVRAHPVEPADLGPAPISFLDAIQRWKVAYYDGVVPIARGYVAAAVRRRTPADRRLHTARERSREMLVTAVERLHAGVRAALETSGIELLDVPEMAGQPARAQEAARRVIENARVAIEKQLGEAHAATLAADEWLVLDGVLSESALLARHPRALGVIKSHGAQYFEGDDLTLALTIPALHRTSVFKPRGRARNEVHSWYLRLWPWEGNDILFGLLRIEARAFERSPAVAQEVSGWLVRERAPVSTPDARWDRLLYPIHDVETYLKARAPRELLPAPASRLPRAS